MLKREKVFVQDCSLEHVVIRELHKNILFINWEILQNELSEGIGIKEDLDWLRFCLF